MRRDGSCLIHGASIKGQCARHKFYGSTQVEDWLGKLESKHAAVYRAIVDIAWNKRSTLLSDDENLFLREAIILQRVRTPRHAHTVNSMTNDMLLHVYTEYLKSIPTTPKQKADIEAIQEGRVAIKGSFLRSLVFSLRLIPRIAIAISDLALLILRNRSTVPFIMGDSPCVFSNRYMKDVKEFGVLGLMSPGLMAILPINSQTQVLLYDDTVYQPDYVASGCVDVFQRADISILNALQVHAAEQNVYFAGTNAASYVRDLLSAHKSRLQDHRGVFVTRNLNAETTLHIFEAQLPIIPDLSFISTASPSRTEGLNRVRSSALARQVEQATGRQRTNSPVDISDLAKLIESEIQIYN